MAQTKIEWTEVTWNPTTGCTKISAGCKNCYAEKMANRLKLMGQKKYENGFNLTLHENTLVDPYHWNKPRAIFVNSMSDLFHEDIPFEFIEKVFKVMNENQRHTFQVLTKRADVLLEYHDKLNWTDNIWMGVTVESIRNVERIDMLSQTNAKLKFLSCEPLLTALPHLKLDKIDWVIVGGESGSKSRPIREEWVLDIQEQCSNSEIPFFFKQWGGTNKKKSGKLLNGRIVQELPNK
jgi:protein gp37